MSYQGFTATFGEAKAGLASVKRVFLDKTENLIGSWGGSVLEIGSGIYAVYEDMPSTAYWIAWRTGDADEWFIVKSVREKAFSFTFGSSYAGREVIYRFLDNSGNQVGSEVPLELDAEFLPAENTGIYLAFNDSIPGAAVWVEARVKDTTIKTAFSLSLYAREQSVSGTDIVTVDTYDSDVLAWLNSDFVPLLSDTSLTWVSPRRGVGWVYSRPGHSDVDPLRPPRISVQRIGVDLAPDRYNMSGYIYLSKDSDGVYKYPFPPAYDLTYRVNFWTLRQKDEMNIWLAKLQQRLAAGVMFRLIDTGVSKVGNKWIPYFLEGLEDTSDMTPGEDKDRTLSMTATLRVEGFFWHFPTDTVPRVKTLKSRIIGMESGGTLSELTTT